MPPPADAEPSAGTAVVPVSPPHAPDELPARAGRFAVGVVSRAGAWLDVASGGNGRVHAPVVVDVALGAAGVVADAAVTVVRTGWRVTGPVRSVLGYPPLVPRAYAPATLVASLERRGRSYVEQSEAEADAVVVALLPRIVDAALDRLDLTGIVLARVDLDRVVAAVDLDAAVARVDLLAAIDRLDLTALVRERVDLDAIVADVDLDAAVERVDMEAIIQRLDLAAIVNQVIDEIDLPEIIRESTGSVASETVRGVRMQSIEADQAIQRAIDRLLRRRRVERIEAAADGADGADGETSGGDR